MRRVLRPGSRLMRTLPFDANATPRNLLERVNSGAVSAAPPVVVPPGVPTVDQAATAAVTVGLPAWVRNSLRRYPWLPLAVLTLAIVVAVLSLALIPTLGFAVAAAIIAGGAYLYRLLGRWRTLAGSAASVDPQNQTPAAVDGLPKSPDFTINQPGSTVRPSIGATDSSTATRFKSALRDSYSLVTTSATVSSRPAPTALNLTALTSKMITAVDPAVTIPKRGLAIINIPARIRDLLSADFAEVMAYPKIDLPMYEPLKRPTERFLPNINLIPPNSITLLETNQKFIETYMVA